MYSIGIQALVACEIGAREIFPSYVMWSAPISTMLSWPNSAFNAHWNSPSFSQSYLMWRYLSPGPGLGLLSDSGLRLIQRGTEDSFQCNATRSCSSQLNNSKTTTGYFICILNDSVNFRSGIIWAAVVSAVLIDQFPCNFWPALYSSALTQFNAEALHKKGTFYCVLHLVVLRIL